MLIKSTSLIKILSFPMIFVSYAWKITLKILINLHESPGSDFFLDACNGDIRNSWGQGEKGTWMFSKFVIVQFHDILPH